MAEKNVLEDLTHCPICFNSFQRPKCLPCLHNFCESCLNQYILSIFEKGESQKDGFHCPICRHFVGVSKPEQEQDYTGKWAEQFPLNHLVLTLMDQKSLQEGNLLCNPCKKKSKNERSSSWCSDCKIPLCHHCAEYHDSLPILEDHKIVSLDDAKDSILSLSSQHLLCDIHPEKKLDMYCIDHDVGCCATCTMISHRKCERVDTLENVAKDAKTADSNDDLEQRFRKQLKLTEDLLSLESVQSAEFARGCEQMKETVVELTEKNIAHLRNLSSKALSEISHMQEKELSARHTNLEIYKGKMKTVENYQRLLSVMATRSSNVQYFLESKKIKTRLTELEQKMDHTTEQCTLEFRIHPVFSELLNYDSLGHVVTKENVDGKNIKSPDMEPVCNEVNVETPPEAKECPGLRAEGKVFIRDIETSKCNSNVTSCLYLNGRIIIIDNKAFDVRNGHLRVYSENSFVPKLVNFKGKPWDATLLSSSYMAVTVPTSGKICILETEYFITVDTWLCRRHYFGITVKESLGDSSSLTEDERRRCLFYVSSRGNIYLVNLEWDICQKFELSERYISYITYSNGNIYYGVEDKLTCIDETGKSIWEFGDENLKGVRGITKGPNEDILVCGYDSGNLFCVSKIGDRGQEILKLANIVLAAATEDFRSLVVVSGGGRDTNYLSQWNIEK